MMFGKEIVRIIERNRNNNYYYYEPTTHYTHVMRKIREQNQSISTHKMVDPDQHDKKRSYQFFSGTHSAGKPRKN